MSDLDDLASAAQSRGAPRRGLPPFAPLPPQPVYANPAPHYPAVPTPAGAERCWTVHDRGHQYGPHTELELASLVGVGTISPTAMAWREGSPRWIPVSSIVPVPSFAPAYVAPAYASHVPENSPNRIAAGVLGIFLGCFGIHKFILGYSGAGVIMLLTTIFGSLCYGLGFFVMGLIGFIEGIIYLTKSEEQFRREYVLRRREWF